MAEPWSSRSYTNTVDRRQSEFRKLLSNISERLLPEEVARCSFINDLPKDRTASALDALEYLMRKGTFSHTNVDPLGKLLKDINRHDLVTQHVDTYISDANVDSLSKSLPISTSRAQQQIPQTERSNTVPSGTTLSSGIPTSLAVQESLASSATAATSGEIPTHSNDNNIPAFSLGQSSRGECLTPQETSLSSHRADGDSSLEQTEALTSSLGPRAYTPVKWNDELSLNPQERVPQSSSSSMNELEQYNTSQSMEPTHYTTYNQSVTTPSDPPNFTQTIPKLSRNSKGLVMNPIPPPTGHSTPTYSRGSSPATLGQNQRQSIGARSLSESRAHRPVTPLEIVNKRISEPSFPLRQSPGPRSVAPLRPGSGNSGWSELSQASQSHFPVEQTQQENDGDVFTSSQQSSQADGTEVTPHSPGLAESGSEKGKLFRKRPGSRKRLLNKLTGARSNPSSSVSWSVRRKKINEAIYEHQKDKLLKCPKKLELENGRKNSPKLTLYLHPYGYEDDALKNLTLTITLDVSVKCNLPSSAVVRTSVTASETTGERQLNNVIVECPVNTRIIRYKSFLSHRELRELECESIDFTASAKLFTDGLTD